MLLKGVSKVVLGAALCLGMIGGGTVAANASPVVAPGATTAITAATAPSLTETQMQEVTTIQNLKFGESHRLQGSALTVTKTTTGFATSLEQSTVASPMASFCGIGLATAIIGIGAGALAVLAAVTGGGTVAIAGIILTGAQLGVLAGVATSYTAVLGWITLNVC